MRCRRSWIATVRLSGALLATAATAASAACTTDYQQGKGDPSFGAPNALAGKRPPGATVDNLADGGTPGNAPGSKPKCVAAGGTLADGGVCAVSFAKDVLGAFGSANCATVNCHGGATPRVEPRVDPSDGPGMWQGFQGFTLSTGKPYIDPCSTDPATSTVACNLIAEGKPGACGVHMPSGAQLPADAVAKINTWVKCGAPNN